MQPIKIFFCTLTSACLIFACQKPQEEDRGPDPFPNSNTRIPSGDSGFQEGTMLRERGDSRHPEDEAREGRACPDSRLPGQDQVNIDDLCPDEHIRPLVPLSAPTPSESANPMP